MYNILGKTSHTYLRLTNTKRKNKMKYKNKNYKKKKKSKEKKAGECFSTGCAILVPKHHPNLYHPMRY